jgi:hypothetical protein
VKYFDWDDAKNAKLRAERGIGFEDMVFHIERGDLLDILEHPNSDRYASQRIFVVRREDYVYLVPFVEDEHAVFLKTIIPSRTTKQHRGEELDDGNLIPTRGSCSSPSSATNGSRQAEGNASASSTPATPRPRSARIAGRNIRLSSKDLEAIQKRALAEGLPYQTLISSLLMRSSLRAPPMQTRA